MYNNNVKNKQSLFLTPLLKFHTMKWKSRKGGIYHGWWVHERFYFNPCFIYFTRYHWCSMDLKEHKKRTLITFD